MSNTFLWILSGFFSGYIFYEMINFYCYACYSKNVTKYIKYNIILTILVFFIFNRLLL